MKTRKKGTRSSKKRVRPQPGKGLDTGGAVVTATHLYALYRMKCPYLLHLQLFGDRSEKRSMEDREETKLLAEYGNKHEQATIYQIREYEVPEYDQGAFRHGASETAELMRRGVKYIYQGVLLETRELKEGLNRLWDDLGYPRHSFSFIGIPDLLKRVEGKSNLGNYHYCVGDIKSTKQPKFSQKMQVTFYSWLLEHVQGRRPSEGFVIPISGDEEWFSVDLYYWQFLETIEEELHEAVSKENCFYHITSACPQCAWYDHCYKRARETRDVSLIPGLRRAQKKVLLRHGIERIEQVADIDSAQLVGHWGLGRLGLERIKEQAQVMTSGKLRVKSKPEIEVAAVECFFDIESDPYSETEYLFGLLTVTDGSKGRSEKTEQFVALRPTEERKVFLSFLARMKKIIDTAANRAKSVVVYHYGHYEPTHLRILAERHGDPHDVVSEMLKRMVDLYTVVKQCVIMPVESYSLKEVAKHPSVGFQGWEDEASADMSVVWYNYYLRDKDQKWLGMIRRYNEADLRATQALRVWLADLGE